MLYTFFKSFFRDSAGVDPNRVFSFKEMIFVIGEASVETGFTPPYLPDSLEWILDRLGYDHHLTFHSTWHEHRDAREYCQELSKLGLTTYTVTRDCVTVSIDQKTIERLLTK